MNEGYLENRTDTKQLILDAAETLFAKDGYPGTTMRDITGKAGVNLAAINYHFGSKQALLESVIKRRLLPLNQIRRQRLEEIKRDADEKKEKPDVEAVLRAFLEPTLRFTEEGAGSRAFIAIIGRAMSDPDDSVRKIFHKHIKAIFDLFFEMMSAALPSLSKDALFWRVHFALGSMQFTMRICGAGLKELVHHNTDTETLIEYLVEFILNGVAAR